MTLVRRLRRLGVIAAAALVVPALSFAQLSRTIVPEVRVDGILTGQPGTQLGVGAAADAGTYTRLAIDVGAGLERRGGGALTGVQRVDGVARFHFDPFRQSRRGVYAGGGVTLRHAAGAPLHAALAGLLGVEGRRHAGMATAVELGLGGGVRLGLVVRRARRDTR